MPVSLVLPCFCFSVVVLRRGLKCVTACLSRWAALVLFVRLEFACVALWQQPMRTPAQASINIIEKEDAAGMRMQAKYHAMENQALVEPRSYIAFFAFSCGWCACRLRRLRNALTESVLGILFVLWCALGITSAV